MGNALVAVDAVYPSFIAVSRTGPDHAFCSQRDYVRHNANGIRYYSGNRLCASGWETTSSNALPTGARIETFPDEPAASG